MLYVLIFLRNIIIVVNIALSISILYFALYATMYLQYDKLPLKLPYSVFFLESALLGIGAFVAVCFMLLLSYCVAHFVKFLWKTNWWFGAVLLGVYFITNESINFKTYWGNTYNFLDAFFYNSASLTQSADAKEVYEWGTGILIVSIMVILLLLSIFLLRYFNRKVMDFSNRHDCVEHFGKDVS